MWFPSQEKHKCSGEKGKRIKAVRNSPANIGLLELKREGSTRKNLNGKEENTVGFSQSEKLIIILVKLDMEVHARNSSTQELETGGSVI